MIDLIPIVGIICMSCMTLFIVFLITRARQHRVDAQLQMQTRLIDRFGSATDLISFLQSPAGREFVAGVQSAPANLAHERVLAGFRRGILLTSLGAAFLFTSFTFDDSFAPPAAILLFLGGGYLLATFVSYKLSAKLLRDASASTTTTVQ
jgi:hypothetical protein